MALRYKSSWSQLTGSTHYGGADTRGVTVTGHLGGSSQEFSSAEGAEGEFWGSLGAVGCLGWRNRGGLLAADSIVRGSAAVAPCPRRWMLD